MNEFDVLFYDDVGMRFNDRIVENQALGGSELVFWLLAREMGRRGLRVLVWQGYGAFEGEEAFGNVIYRYGACQSPVRTRCVIHHRYSSRAYEMSAAWDSRWVLCSDFWGDHYVQSIGNLNVPPDGIVCVSRWQASQFPSSLPCHVIQCPIPEESYAPVTEARNPHVYLYASAALKGLEPTLNLWQDMRRSHPELHDARLRVLSPGYDNPGMAASRDGVELIGAVPFPRVLQEMRQAAGLFYVNDYPETFCLVAALAEACGARVHIWMRNGGAIPDTVKSTLVTGDGSRFEKDFIDYYRSGTGAGCCHPHNFRIGHITDQWLELLRIA